MARKQIISPKSSTVKVNKAYNLPRGLNVYAKKLGGYSWTDLALYHETSETVVKRWYNTLVKYIDAGLISIPEPIRKETA